MKWRGRRTSRNIEDRRRVRGAAGIGGLGAIAAVLIGMYFGVDLTPLLQGDTLDRGRIAQPVEQRNVIDDDIEAFVGVVLADTEEVWQEIFARSGMAYREPVLVLYAGTTPSACGTANAAVGPFYCPRDQKVFLDTDFFGVLSNQLGAKGDFAMAYVIAHEVAHHVQNLVGTLTKVERLKAEANEAEANALSVRVELQADCYSGIWARAAEERFGSLEQGDLAEAMNAAAKIGDDALQAAHQGVVVPDSFTHGSSQQRQTWFAKGYRTGDPTACDTFKPGAIE